MGNNLYNNVVSPHGIYGCAHDWIHACWILLIQQSLIFTPMHLNKYWRMTLEVWVAIHGAITAAQSQHMSGMFLFGFMWMAVFTQINGLPYYLAFVDETNADESKIAVETGREETSHLDNFKQFVPTVRWKRWCLRLTPPILYFVVVIASYQTWLSVADQTLTLTGKVFAVLFFAYGAMVAVSIVFESFHVQMNLIVQMIVLVSIFAVIALFVMVVMEKDMRRINLVLHSSQGPTLCKKVWMSQRKRKKT